MPRTGPSSKRIDQIVNLARTQLKRRLIASWGEIRTRSRQSLRVGRYGCGELVSRPLQLRMGSSKIDPPFFFQLLVLSRRMSESFSSLLTFAIIH